MAKHGEEMLRQFFRERFGGLIADTLVEQKLDEFRIDNFDSLPHSEQIAVAQMIVESMFSRFYSPEKTKDMKLLYTLSIALNSASEKITEWLKKECTLKIEPLKDLNISDLEKASKQVKDDEMIKLFFSWSSGRTGCAVCMLRKKAALELAKNIMRASGKPAINDNLDDEKLSFIKRFFDSGLRVFCTETGRLTGMEISYSQSSAGEFEAGFTDKGKIRRPERAVLTRLITGIDRDKEKVDILILTS